MKLFLSLFCLLPLFSFAQTRFAAGPLSLSVNNERDAAIDRATPWVITQQNSVGYWGDQDAKLTAIAVLALAGDGLPLSPESQNAVALAISWLKSPSATNALSAFSPTKSIPIRCWRDMALALFDPSFPQDVISLPLSLSAESNVLYPFLETISLRNRLSGNSFSIPSPNTTNLLKIISSTNDLIAASYLLSDSDSSLSRLANPIAKQFRAEDPPAPYKSCAESAWWLAHTINRYFNGELIDQSHDQIVVTDWRNRLANRWITTQKSDDHGHGHWDDSLPQTLFALLLLKEL